MNEEVFTLTMPEAEYCLKVCELAALGTSGSDLSNTFRKLHTRLEAELHKPVNLDVSLNAEEKNELVKAVMIYELLVREKYDVLRDHFNLQNILISNDEIKQKAAVIGMTIEKGPVDVSVLQKKLRYSKRIPTRKLYISDLHFFHDSLNHRMDMRGFSGYEEMNAHMIRQWNDHVTKKDEVYILGDFAISRGKAANEVLGQMNGKKYLIEGNHDKFLDDKEFDRSLFRWIRPYAEIRDCRRQVILSHYPVFCYKGQYRMTPEGTPLTYMLYGHVHNTHDERLVNEFIRITRSTMVKSARQTEEHPIPCNMINCFCMFSDYIPLTLDDWIRLDKGRRERTDTIQGHII